VIRQRLTLPLTSLDVVLETGARIGDSLEVTRSIGFRNSIVRENVRSQSSENRDHADPDAPIFVELAALFRVIIMTTGMIVPVLVHERALLNWRGPLADAEQVDSVEATRESGHSSNQRVSTHLSPAQSDRLRSLRWRGTPSDGSVGQSATERRRRLGAVGLRQTGFRGRRPPEATRGRA